MIEFIAITIIIGIFTIGVLVVILQKRSGSNKRSNYRHKQYTPEEKGQIGENIVANIIDECLDQDEFLLNDYMLEVNGMTCQIDHIAIVEQGVFVVETKNYSGNIYGRQYDDYWTQTLNYGKVKNKIYNPVKQNEGHVYRLKKILPNAPLKPIVVLVQENQGKIQANNIIPLSSLDSFICAPSSTKLTKDERYNILNILLANQSLSSKEQHINNINKRYG